MSDDFFSNASAARPAAPPHLDPDPDAHDDFALAISVRFGSADLSTARLLPGDLPPSHHRPPSPPPPPPPPRPPTLPPQQPFSSLPPSALAPYLADPHSLILDIRPHAAHVTARVNHALSLSVPTTLLKRPLFSLSKLSQMLPSPSSRARFADWSSASSILVYDSDSAFSPDTSIIAGLLRKFRTEGFTGELSWVRGGFQAVWKEARHLTTTQVPTPEEDDPDPASSSGTLRATHLPRAAFSLSSTTVAPPLQLAAIPGSYPLPNTPAPSASRAANPFFDTIRQNVELSHGITERIPLRLPRRVRRRIHDLPFPWLRDIARRSALRQSSVSRHPGLDSLESGSESSDDPHTSDPDENDPTVEEGTEALAMQFYRIELAEQRRLRSIMEHHTRESELASFAASAKPRTIPGKTGASIYSDRSQGGVMSGQTGAKSAPGTPHPTAFPFSITAGVEKGTKNRYTHVWPFEHARVRLHDARHQGSHSGRREKGKASERSRSTRDRSGGKGKEREERGQKQDKHQRSRSGPAFGESQDREVVSTSRYAFYLDAEPSISDTSVGFAHPTLSSSRSVPQVKIEYDVTEQDSKMSGPPTPATALPLQTPPFYTPLETPMRARPPQLLSLPSGIGASSGGRLGGAQFASPASSLPSLGPLPSFPLRLPNCSGGVFPSINVQTRGSESLSLSVAPFDAFPAGTVGGVANNSRTKSDPWIESSPVDDYVNASYVQPLGTRKRYIATQGPLPSTYVDFWTLVWEQNVHVIVMLTREVENAVVKCGSYWTDTEYGPLRLELLHTSPPVSPSPNRSSMDISKQGFFAIREPQGKASGASRDQPSLITRTFALTHTSYPGVPPRKITHLQYLDWSDMNVPEDPRGVLDLVKKVEQVVVESMPGPSPGRSLSPGSGSGSLSGSQSPDIASDQKGYGTSLLSPTSTGVIPEGGRRRRGNGWRHPELDSKTGIAAFALGKQAPVLLHCSAGVGRTGGFIAVDAMLDAIRRELRKSRDEGKLKKSLKVSLKEKVGVSDVEASADFSVESTETGVNTMDSRGESIPDERRYMDVDEPTTDKAEKAQDPLYMMNTVPIHVSVGDRMKGRKHHYPSKAPPGEKQSSSSESLVVHVPYARSDDVPEGTIVAGIDLGDPREVGWQSSSTRQWAEQVSDQTRAHAEEGNLPPPPSVLPPSRERSPGSASNSSGPSALNSVDDSMNVGASANAGGSASANGSGSGNRMERKSHAGSGTGSGSGSRGPPPSSVSKPGSGSISLSNSASGTGMGSLFGSSSLRPCLRDSSVTSISAESTDSFSPEHELKLNAPIHLPSAILPSSSSDMEIDCPPRPVSVPLQPAYPSMVDPHPAVQLRHNKSMLGSSPGTGSSSPILPPAAAREDIPFLDSDIAEGSASQPSSDLSSEKSPSPPQELESGESADTEESGKNSQVPSDESEESAAHTKSGSNLRINTELGFLKGLETLHSSGSARIPPFLSRGARGRENAAIPLVPHDLDDSVFQQCPVTSGVAGSLEDDQRIADYPVIDYKLPRELHSDLSPPLISSLTAPVCMVIQDIREQRMSLCQSLRQYVFVHAAIIEGALKIVDEERELWGYGGTSDDASSGEGEPGTGTGKSVRRLGRSEAKAWLGGGSEAEVAIMTPEFEYGHIPNRSRPYTIAQPSNHWNSEDNSGGGQVPLVPIIPPSGISSPSKGKRGPSPTELLREDKTGALSLNKRPSIHRKTRSAEGNQLSFELNKSSPVVGETGGGPRDTVVGTSAHQSTPGRRAVPEKRGFTSGGAR